MIFPTVEITAYECHTVKKSEVFFSQFENDKAIVTYFSSCIACSVLDLEEIIIVKKIQYISKLSISDYDKIHSKAQQTIKIKEHDIQALKMKKKNMNNKIMLQNYI